MTFPVLERPASVLHSKESIREEVEFLHSQQDQFCCAFYDAGASTTAAIFGGSAEQFHILSVARHLKCNVVVFSSNGSFWFKGSSTLPPIQDIGKALADLRFGKVKVLFGQSSGGYAALAASKDIEGAVAIAVSPQTFDDRSTKSRIRFSTYLKPSYTEDGLLDLREYLATANQNSIRTIISSASEYTNPYEGLFWVDHLHAFRMIDVPTIEMVMIRSSIHSSVWRNAENYARMLAEVDAAQSPETIKDAIFGVSETVSQGHEQA